MLYANIHQLYCHILQTENFFIQHPFQPLSAVNTTTEPKVLQPKLHDIKKKRCFVPKYTSYTAIYCDRNIYSKSTPSGCFQHAKIPLIPNFGVLFHRVTPPLYSADSADWTMTYFINVSNFWAECECPHFGHGHRLFHVFTPQRPPEPWLSSY